MRATVNALLGIPLLAPPRRRDPVRVAFMNRCPHVRCIKNHDAVVKALEESSIGGEIDMVRWVAELGLGGDKYSRGSINYEKLSLKEQVMVQANTDVFIGVLGAGLVNAVFLPAHSAVIEIQQLGFADFMLGAAAVTAGSLHLPMYAIHLVDCKLKVAPQCNARPYALLDTIGMRSCMDPSRTCSVQFDADTTDRLVMQMHEAVRHVHMRKRMGAYDGLGGRGKSILSLQ